MNPNAQANTSSKIHLIEAAVSVLLLRNRRIRPVRTVVVGGREPRAPPYPESLFGPSGRRLLFSALFKQITSGKLWRQRPGHELYNAFGGEQKRATAGPGSACRPRRSDGHVQGRSRS